MNIEFSEKGDEFMLQVFGILLFYMLSLPQSEGPHLIHQFVSGVRILFSVILIYRQFFFMWFMFDPFFIYLFGLCMLRVCMYMIKCLILALS